MDKNTEAAFGSIGGPEAVITALKTYKNNSDVVVNCCRAIHNTAFLPANKKKYISLMAAPMLEAFNRLASTSSEASKWANKAHERLHCDA